MAGELWNRVHIPFPSAVRTVHVQFETITGKSRSICTIGLLNILNFMTSSSNPSTYSCKRVGRNTRGRGSNEDVIIGQYRLSGDVAVLQM